MMQSMKDDLGHVDQVKLLRTPKNRKNSSIKMMKSPRDKASWRDFSEDEWPCPDYRIESILGKGSYGVVARAVQISTG